MTQPNVVNVEIAGEEYAIRTVASPEHTRDCAAHVDRTIAEIVKSGALLQPHKAGILAALAVTDDLFQARRELAELQAEVQRLTSRLASDVEERLGAADLAARS